MKITLNSDGTVTVVMPTNDFRYLLEDAMGNESANELMPFVPGKGFVPAPDVDSGDNGDEDEDGEPMGSFDLSDDAEALASAGFGTDEDYGYYGDEF